jgi:digeranylgeranylglycerophospholipid reductase
MRFDLLIVGAGFAGLAAARTAASRGLTVGVIDAKREAGARVHTSGILVREAIEEIDIPHRLTRRIPGVRLYSPSLKSADLFAPGYAFYTTRTADLLRWMAAEAREAGATVMNGVRFNGARRDGDLIRLVGIDLSARYLIGADGARSRVAAAFGLSENRRFLTGLEVELEPDDALDPRFLHCFVDSKLAPGYIAWAAPGPDAVQVGLAVRHGARPELAAFMAHTEPVFGWGRLRVMGRRSGLIPCGGPLRKTAAPGVMLVGDAAGWVSPNRRRHPPRLQVRPPRRLPGRRSFHERRRRTRDCHGARSATLPHQGTHARRPRHGTAERVDQPRACRRAGARLGRTHLLPFPQRHRNRPGGIHQVVGR